MVVRRALVVALAILALLSAQRAAATTGMHSLHATGRSYFTAYTPPEIARAYDFSSLARQHITGAGQTVALIEIDRFNPSDLHQFDRAYTLHNPKVQVTYIGGQKFLLPIEGETAMDVEWVHALAPGAALHVYYLPNVTSQAAVWTEMTSAVNQAVEDHANIISISLGTCGPGIGSQTVQSALAAAYAKGVSVFVSSGDSGDHAMPIPVCGNRVAVSYPAGDPSVVAVGGTSVSLSVSNKIVKEQAWSLSGGGVAAPLLRPSWQVAPQLPKDDYRWAPDVAFLGDAQTGVVVYFKGRFHQVAGTSLGAPCWAAAWALIRQSAQQAGVTVGVAPPLIYDVGNSSLYRSAFHDITVGSNGTYHAGPGWDPVTGWGTPDVGKLAQAIQTVAANP